MKRFACMAILLLSPGLLVAAPAVDPTAMTGLWKTDSNIMGQSVRMMCALTETNHNLSGVCSGGQDGYAAHKIAGSVKGQKVQFYFQAVYGGNSLTTIVSGTLNEDRTKMDGDMEVKPMGGGMDAGAMGGGMDAGAMDISGALTAVRERDYNAAAAQADAVAAQTDAIAAQAWAAEAQAALATGDHVATNNEVATAGTEAAEAGTTGAASVAASMVATGTWKIDGTVMGTTVTMTCVLTEAEHELAGTCSGAGEGRTPRALTGTATAKGVGWRFDDEYQGQPITFSMNATPVSDGRMSGTMAVAPFGAQGTFVAVRQPPPPN